jgi:predicted molibdopterin-dependent oxidoreductase YjgC
MVNITINGRTCAANEGTPLIAAAAAAGGYIPGLCHHPDLRPFCDVPRAAAIFRGMTRLVDEPVDEKTARDLEGCGLCVVEIAGQAEPVRACRARLTVNLTRGWSSGAP